MRPEKAAGLQRVQLPPGNWFAAPDGKRGRLILSNEKRSFLGISLRAAGRHQFLCWELSVKNARFEQLRLLGSTPNSADYNRDGDDSR